MVTEVPVLDVNRNFIPSAEQIAIVNHLKTHHVVVSANPNTLIAVVTYSKRLQLDNQRRFQSYPLVDVFTFHGLASRFFGTIIHNDTVFADVRRSARPPVWIDVPRYEIVILDELQDLTENLYWLTCTFITFLTQLLVLGDSRQAIYEFRGADQRYLEQSPNILPTVTPHQWKSAQLSQSFRLSRQTANFINNAFLGGEPYIQGSHEGPKPLYIHGYGPENTAILAPSLRSSAVVKRIINALWKKYKVPAAHAVSDDQRLNDDITRGKITLSTYHQFKGSERDLVIVLGVDASYFNLHPTCQTIVLVVLHSHKEPHMPFVNWAAIKSGVDFVNIEDTSLQSQYKPELPLRSKFHLPQTIHVSAAARYVREEDLDRIVRHHLDIRKVRTDVVKNQWEPVSDVNGLTVTLDFEYWLTGKVAIFMNGTHMEHIPADKALKDDTFRAVWLSKGATRYDANTSGFKSRWRQMAYQRHRFDWTVPHLAVFTQRLSEQFLECSRPELAKELTMEVPLQQQLSMDDQTTTLRGWADMIHSRNKGRDVAIWEVKFVTVLSHEHVIQVVIYGYLWAMANQMQPFPRLVLYNVKNNEKWEIKTTLVCVKQVIEEVLQIKPRMSKGVSMNF
ncbi:P-loop containing nucleoside triphosphate hydrolase protein [Armillaria fumosa]|nr:P-loop containing nucleoside triphosphate hydrolase protein [Armillaria fumosa]